MERVTERGEREIEREKVGVGKKETGRQRTEAGIHLQFVKTLKPL